MYKNGLDKEIKIVINRNQVINTNIEELFKLVSNNDSSELESLLSEINKELINKETNETEHLLNEDDIKDILNAKEPQNEILLNQDDINEILNIKESDTEYLLSEDDINEILNTKESNTEYLLSEDDINDVLNEKETQNDNLLSEDDIENILNNSNKDVNMDNLLSDINKIENTKILNSESILPEDYILYENGILSNIVLGKTSSDEVIERMKAYNNSLVINENINVFAYSYMYQDLDVTICFDKNNISQEVTLGKNFKGKTFKGLKIANTLEKSVVLYGEPDKNVKTNMFKLFSWENLTIFFQDDKVSHIRYRV